MAKVALQDRDILWWILENKIKNEKGTLIDFKDHPFFYQIYRDFSPFQVGYKAAQIGWSTTATFKSLWGIRRYGLDAIYTLPTDSDVTTFVSGKVNRLIAANPVLQGYTKDKDSVEQKAVGGNMIYYRGTWTERTSIMVTSDLNIHDEVDSSKQNVVQEYESRLQHSKFKWQWYFSHPSVEGNGVSRFWNLSDQKHWFIKCRFCNKRQYLSWPHSIDRARQIFICKHCQAELTDDDRRLGEWVQKYKNKEYSGYWIPLLICPWVSAKEIIDKFDNKPRQFFWNKVLGLPYIGEGNVVVPDLIYRNLTSELNSQESVVIGCDSGLRKHYVCGNREGIFFYGVTETWDDIRSLLRRWPRSMAVIDALPDLTEPRKLREEFRGRVFLCHYARDRKTFQLIRWGHDREEGNVVVDRNRTIQLVIDEFADRRIPLQGNIDDYQDYVRHWRTLYRLVEEDELGVPQFTWNTSTGEDHWCHATVYWRVGMDRFGGSGQGRVLTLPPAKSDESPEIDVASMTHQVDLSKHFILEARDKQDDWRKT